MLLMFSVTTAEETCVADAWTKLTRAAQLLLITWYVAEGSETNLKNISLDANSATVIRASKVKGAQISAVSFTVTDDEGNNATMHE